MSYQPPTTGENAVTNGYIPVQIGAVLLFIAGGISSYLAIELSVGIGSIVAAFTGGVIAAIGIKENLESTIKYVNVSVLGLFLGVVLLLAGVAGSIQGSTPVQMGVVAVSACCVFFTGFGISTNSLRSMRESDGETYAGRDYILKYAVTTGVSILMTVLLFAVSLTISGVSQLGGSDVGVSVSIIQVLDGLSIHQRIIGSVLAYGAAAFIVQSVGDKIPLECLFGVEKADKVMTIRSRSNTIFTIALRVIGVYLLLSVVWGVLDAFYPVDGLALVRSVVSVGAHPVVIQTALLLIAVAVSVLFITKTLDYMTRFTVTDLVTVSLVPLVICVIAVLVGVVFKPTVLELLISNNIASESGNVYTVFDSYPIPMVASILTIMQLPGVVLYVAPLIVKETQLGNPALTGVIVSLTGMGGLVLFNVLVWNSFIPVIIGAVAIVSLWELSEYTIVSVGELYPEHAHNASDGIFKLIGVRGVATLLTGVAAIAVSVGGVVVLTGVSIPTNAAAAIVLLSTISVISLISLLSV